VIDRLTGVWLLDGGEGVLLLTTDGWYSMQVAGGTASAGHFGVDGDRFLMEPMVAAPPAAAGHLEERRWTLDGDVLVIDGADGAHRWHRESTEVVTGLGSD